MTVQDLRPNSQDTSAFYLGNIYGVLADPNATRAPIPSPAEPPPFSAPRYAIWVNSLWFLSLVMSLSCALWATSLHQWARRYIRLSQPARCGPEKRARMRSFFAEGVDKMHIRWAVEVLPTLQHLSLFLFFGGLVIYLFNMDQEVFLCVVWWIGLFSTAYGLITLLPLIRHNSPYNSPLSQPTWFLYSSVKYVTVTVVSFIASWCGSRQTWIRCDNLRDVYRGWMLGEGCRGCHVKTVIGNRRRNLGLDQQCSGRRCLSGKGLRGHPWLLQFNASEGSRKRLPFNTTRNVLACVG